MGKLCVPHSGHALLHKQPIAKIKAKKFARQVSFLAQNPISPDGYTVEQLVMLGRYPYLGLFGKPTLKDHQTVNKAMAQVDLGNMKDTPLEELSGGQRQRAWIAMAIAQDTPYIILDEPTSFLDLSCQLSLLDLLIDLRDNFQKTIIMVIHDLNLASYYADEIIVLKSGKLITQGPKNQVLNETLLNQVFNVNTQVFTCNKRHTRTFIPSIKDSSA